MRVIDVRELGPDADRYQEQLSGPDQKYHGVRRALDRRHTPTNLRSGPLRSGEVIEVTDQGRPIARLAPVEGMSRYDQLVASGELIPAGGDPLEVEPIAVKPALASHRRFSPRCASTSGSALPGLLRPGQTRGPRG